MRKKWSVEVVKRKETIIEESEMQEKLADVWELLHSLSEPPAHSLPKADKPVDVKDSPKRSAS